MYHLRNVSGVKLALAKYLFIKISADLGSGSRADKKPVGVRVLGRSFFFFFFFCTVEFVWLAVMNQEAEEPIRKHCAHLDLSPFDF